MLAWLSTSATRCRISLIPPSSHSAMLSVSSAPPRPSSSSTDGPRERGTTTSTGSRRQTVAPVIADGNTQSVAASRLGDHGRRFHLVHGMLSSERHFDQVFFTYVVVALHWQSCNKSAQRAARASGCLFGPRYGSLLFRTHPRLVRRLFCRDQHPKCQWRQLVAHRGIWHVVRGSHLRHALPRQRLHQQLSLQLPPCQRGWVCPHCCCGQHRCARAVFCV